MCILFVYVDDGSAPGRYRLVLASNRDEFYARPANPAAPWEENASIFGGRDMEPGREGGTWLAIGNHPEGRIKLGALLNVTGETKPNVTNGRGPIVANFLTGEQTARAYSEQLLADDNFGAFNFVSIELDTKNGAGRMNGPNQTAGATVLHTSNAPHSIVECQTGEALGFGNSTLDKPLRKVNYGSFRFAEILSRLNLDSYDKDRLVAELMALLGNDKRHFPDDELTRRAGEHAEFLSSINVRMPNGSYGSRTRTVILIDQSYHMELIEETLVGTDPQTGEWITTRIERDFS